LLFGRGFRAGIDRREQKKLSSASEAETLRRGRTAAGITETREHRRVDADRAARSERYDAADMRIDTHWSEKPRSAMTERDWRIFREDFNIGYKGAVSGATLPVRNWDELSLPPELRKAIDKAGYVKPSPIQMASIPLGLQQRDVIGIAETGSGKTAAFVLPMLVYIMKQPAMAGNPEIEAEGPYAVVLAPTRELAQQIEEEARTLAAFTPFRVVGVVGGQPIEDQGFLLRKGCEIVVATPGRLVDCSERSYAVLNQCNYVVLDEADRMIDMGFEPQVMGVLDAMPSTNLKPENEEEELDERRVYRTTYMFSATMPPTVERLARKYLRRPVVVTIGTAGRATDNVTQRVSMVKENEKDGVLQRELADQEEDARIIVFGNTQKKCEQIMRLLQGAGYRVTMLHGGKSQDQREESIKGFREERYNVLVATDVAGRGIDVPNVALVVNYDMPNNIEAYTHRIGRTGRAGRKGVAFTMLTLADSEVFFDLKKFLEESKAAVPSQLAAHEASRQKPGTGGGRPSVQYAKK
jgi:ATP-dependent RNA helicase DDX23/PRP28